MNPEAAKAGTLELLCLVLIWPSAPCSGSGQKPCLRPDSDCVAFATCAMPQRFGGSRVAHSRFFLFSRLALTARRVSASSSRGPLASVGPAAEGPARGGGEQRPHAVVAEPLSGGWVADGGYMVGLQWWLGCSPDLAAGHHARGLAVAPVAEAVFWWCCSSVGGRGCGGAYATSPMPKSNPIQPLFCCVYAQIT